MAKDKKTYGKLNVHLGDEDSAAAVKMVLAYEATVRGRTIGQACSELIAEAADIDSYPEEVRARLAEIAEAAERRAVAKSLEMTEPTSSPDGAEFS